MGSCGPPELDDRQVFATLEMAQDQPQSRAPICPTVRRPTRARLNALPSGCRHQPLVGLHRRAATQRRAGSMLVVPYGVESQPLLDHSSGPRNQNPVRAFCLHRPNEPFNDGDAALFLRRLRPGGRGILPQHPAHGRAAEVQTGPCERLGDPGTSASVRRSSMHRRPARRTSSGPLSAAESASPGPAYSAVAAGG
jgi:hypothetical protein